MRKHLSPVVSLLAIIIIAGGFWLGIWSEASGGALDVFNKWGWNAITNTSNVNSGNYQLTGLGWISFNCVNDFDYDGVVENRCPTANYGLNINVDGTNNTSSASAILGDGNDYVQGCIWSATFGWICFDQDPTYCPNNANYPGCTKLSNNGVTIKKLGSYPLYYLDNTDPNNETVKARASILSLAEIGSEARSYIGFPADFTSPEAIVDKSTLGSKIMNCIGCTGSFTGSCDACVLTNDGTYVDSTEAPNPNIVCTQCSSCTVLQRGGSCAGAGDPNNRYCNPSSCAACFRSKGTIVNYYKSCEKSGAWCTQNSQCGSSGGTCNYKNSKAELCGWAYNAYSEPDGSKITGLTWIAWNPAIYGQATPFFQGRSGSIYSRFDIRTFRSLPTGKYNATYLIDAGSTISQYLVSASSTPSLNLVRPGLAQPPSFPSPGGLFATSSLGYLDIGGLTTDVTGGNAVNKYGSTIVTIQGSTSVNTLWNEDSNTGVTLDNKVFHIKSADASNRVVGNASVLQAKFIKPGNAGNGKSGAGIIVVDGDLWIESNVVYSNGSYSRLKQIPSLVWIVKGDVYIHPNVTQVDGTFIVLGDGSPRDCPQIGDPLGPQNSDGCGRLITGNDPDDRRQLIINGLAIARQFNLQRTYIGDPASPQAAEQFVADGRLQANPPSGLSDFSKSLPRFGFGF